jgi:hypothetical protein
MGILTDVASLQEIGIIRWKAEGIRVYWKKTTKEVYFFHEGTQYIQSNDIIRDSLARFIPAPFTVACCAVYEANGEQSMPMNTPSDLLDCEWSDFACDRLLIQARIE